ncbi:Leukocyte-associated immunoglobulin-like receptor 1 [Myotis brandtii]|nr:Leukocyte-associated immunoglobulin-like receptor 1 [Myotis brandtii]
MSKVTAGRYRCLYKRMNYGWSQLSEPLLLQVTEEDDSTPHSGAPRVLSSTLSSTPSSTPSSAPSSTSVTDTKPLSAGLTRLLTSQRAPQSPDAGDAQEVTYAQLDPRALTLRAAQAVPPQPTEPTADSSTYAELPRR